MHTKGPWDHYMLYPDRSDQAPVFEVESKSGVGVARTIEANSLCEEAECEANARLIAAAPTMLETLKLIIEHLQPPKDMSGCMPPDLRWVIEVTQHAIDKATPEEKS